MKIDVTVAVPYVEVNAKPQTAAITIGSPVLREHIGADPYPGPYEVTPTQSTQTLSTEDLLMVQDVTINPIPSNYGLITWDGAVLTVS